VIVLSLVLGGAAYRLGASPESSLKARAGSRPVSPTALQAVPPFVLPRLLAPSPEQRRLNSNRWTLSSASTQISGLFLLLLFLSIDGTTKRVKKFMTEKSWMRNPGPV